MIGLIVAHSKNNVIGKNGQIPWKIKGEQKQFRELTTGNVFSPDSVPLTDIRNRNGWIESVISHVEYNNRFTVSFGKVFAEVYFL